MLHQVVTVWTNEVRVEGREPVDWRRPGHGHRERRYSHVVCVNVGMGLRTIPSDWPSSQLSSCASDEHYVITGWVQCPVVTFAGIIVWSGNFDKALV